MAGVLGGQSASHPRGLSACIDSTEGMGGLRAVTQGLEKRDENPGEFETY